MSELPYIVSARKYRPATFRSVVGQKALTETLKNAVATGRIAQAYLFCGPRGVGKTTCARIFAKTINCLHPTAEGEACGQCEACKAIEEGNSFNLLELDAASNNSVGNIRDLMDQVNVPPQVGRYRIFIIDEVHMLSSAAFNAFLKTLEEPPAHVVFILATTEKHKILPTILSRCQIYDFKRITIDDMVEHLQYVAEQEGITAEAEALDVIARKADGAMRDALSIFDQVSASCRGNITYSGTVANLNVLDYEYYFRIVDAFAKGDIQDSLLLYNEIRDRGFDSQFFLSGLSSHLRNLMVAADPRTVKLLEVSKAAGEKYMHQAASLPPTWYYRALDILNQCAADYRSAVNKQLIVEIALVKIASMRNQAVIDDMKIAATPAPSAAPQPAAKSAPQPAPQSAPAPSAPQSATPRPASPQPQRQSPTPASSPAHPQPTATQTSARMAAASHSRPSGESGRRSASRSIRLMAEEQQEEGSDSHAASGSATEKKARTTPITEERIMSTWQQYIFSHPDQHIVINTMKTTFPQYDERKGVYFITVDNQGQRDQFYAVGRQLAEYMRSGLDNDSFRIEIRLAEADNSMRKLTPGEFLKISVENNPSLGELLDSLDAVII